MSSAVGAKIKAEPLITSIHLYIHAFASINGSGFSGSMANQSRHPVNSTIASK
jgi:hypothetical protein